MRLVVVARVGPMMPALAENQAIYEKNDERLWQQGYHSATMVAAIKVVMHKLYGKESEMDIGFPELLIILVVIVILFGPGRIGKVAGELGKGIRAFRDGLSGKGEEKKEKEEDVSAEPPKDEK